MSAQDANARKQAGQPLEHDTEPIPPPGDGAQPSPDADTLRGAPTFADAYGPERLAGDRKRTLLSIARLPSWQSGPDEGHGWGDALNRFLGWGFHPGYMLAVGASHAGAGKTAFVMQLAEGLALHTAELVREKKDGPLTPVLVLSEMSAEALTWRSLARWTGCDSRIYRAGESARTDHSVADIDKAFSLAREAFNGPWAEGRRFMRRAEAERGPVAIATVRAIVAAWRKALEADHRGREVWPVVLIDPIQRWQADGAEVEALNGLVEAIGDAAHRDGLIVLVTSDTNKSTATGANLDSGPMAVAANAFRGSYKLIHECDAVLFLDKPNGLTATADRRNIEAQVLKNRWGSSLPVAKVTYSWDVKTGRFEQFDDANKHGNVPMPDTEKKQRQSFENKQRSGNRRGRQ